MKLAQVLLASSMLFASANVFAEEHAAPAAAEAAPAAAEAAPAADAPAASEAPKDEAACKAAHGKWDKKKHTCAVKKAGGKHK